MTDVLNVHSFSHRTASIAKVLGECESLHRKLRPNVQRTYVGHMCTLLAEGALLALGHFTGQLRCLALYRIFQTTLGGARLYIEDLVTDENDRRRGYGVTMLNWLENAAAAEGAILSTLDSRTNRSQAHRFYITHGYAITAFCFERPLRPMGNARQETKPRFDSDMRTY